MKRKRQIGRPGNYRHQFISEGLPENTVSDEADSVSGMTGRVETQTMDEYTSISRKPFRFQVVQRGFTVDRRVFAARDNMSYGFVAMKHHFLFRRSVSTMNTLVPDTAYAVRIKITLYSIESMAPAATFVFLDRQPLRLSAFKLNLKSYLRSDIRHYFRRGLTDFDMVQRV